MASKKTSHFLNSINPLYHIYCLNSKKEPPFGSSNLIVWAANYLAAFSLS